MPINTSQRGRQRHTQADTQKHNRLIYPRKLNEKHRTDEEQMRKIARP